MSHFTCPKCHGPMHSFERNGLTIEQCANCHGIFLDRGELERLVHAEGAYYEQHGFKPQKDIAQHLIRAGTHAAGKHHGHKKHKSKKKHAVSFLGDLLDI